MYLDIILIRDNEHRGKTAKVWMKPSWLNYYHNVPDLFPFPDLSQVNETFSLTNMMNLPFWPSVFKKNILICTSQSNMACIYKTM